MIDLINIISRLRAVFCCLPSCRDEKWRPVEAGSFPLVNGVAQRVERLRAYCNVINAKVAKSYLEAYIEIQHA